jgi:TonB family protein
MEYKQVVTGSSGFLFSVNPLIKNTPVSFSTYTTMYYRGVPNPKTDNSFVYGLPYPRGNSFTVSFMTDLSKSFGNTGAKNFKAFEFSSKSFDTICAVRKGVVVSVVDKYEMDTTTGKSYTSNVNSVLIEQPDGTLASYEGFQRGSIFVKEGQSVLPYTPLGILSYYDVRKLHSLRLMIYYLSNANVGKVTDQPVTLKTSVSNNEFIDPLFLTDMGVTKLMNHKSYRSAFNEFVLENEMSRKELKAIGKKTRELTNMPKVVTELIASLKKDTIYFDKEDNVVSLKDQAVEYAVRWIDADNEHKLWCKSYYLSGKLKTEGYCIDNPETFPIPTSSNTYTDNETGKKWWLQGKFKQWYENGQLQRDLNYKEAMLTGQITTYWDNGQVKRTNVDKNGNLVPDKCFDRNGKEVPVYPYSKRAALLEGKMTIEEFVNSHIVYPDEAIDKGTEGIVHVFIKIYKDGSVANIKIIRSSDPILEKELKRVVMTLPKLKPATKDGDIVASNYELVHSFMLPQLKTDWALKLAKQDTTFYNKASRIVKNREYADYYEILQSDVQNPGLVIERLYYASNEKLSEKHFRKVILTEDFPDSLSKEYGIKLPPQGLINSLIRLPEGKYLEWHKNGQLSKEINYESGKKNGHVRFFWENGKPQRDDVFDNGVLVSGNCFNKEGKPISYIDMDMKASFPGGKKALVEFLSTNLKYPEKALKNKTDATVEVKFIIDTNGSVSSIWIPKSINRDIDMEAIRLIKSMPKWLPEFKDGKAVPSPQKLKIQFVI